MEHTTPRRNPRRRKRSKQQIFREAYLPAILLAAAVILVLVFIIVALSRPEHPDSGDSSSSTQATMSIEQEAASLLTAAKAAAADYDYGKALELLDSFSGDISAFPELKALYDRCTEGLASLVAWDPSEVPNLAFHILVADPQRAYPDETYGSSYKKNFITVNEFSAILEELYAGGYILVDMQDLYTTSYSENAGREVYREAQLLLPPGKKPLMLTEINASYYSYMVDSDGDDIADAGGDGFAANLCYGENGFYNEYVFEDGTRVTGAYDMVPILEDFLKKHPDFSYRGARATIAFTGYDGILGHRTNSTKLTAQQRQAEKDRAIQVVNALRSHGYRLASYTYDNISYSSKSLEQIKTDLELWTEHVTEIIGLVDTLVFARDADIGTTGSYMGNPKFTTLYTAGFRYFMGVSGSPWNQVGDLYVRHNRLMLTGTNLTSNPKMFEDLFDASKVLDAARG